MNLGGPNFLLGLAIATTFAGCSPDVRERPLVEVDLANSRAVAAIGRHLGVRERTAFTTYALVHWPGSKFYCGSPLRLSASPPRTVGEAIESTLRFEERLAARRSEERDEKTRSVRLEKQDRKLIDRYEALLLKRQMLATAAETNVGDRAEIAAINDQMDRLQHERRQLFR